ncbi:hypothetical protein DFQ28_003335 [Apophysomyces sp. BC1034]|nr:hypothetical protein DFQ30_003034 [Apophysomyces sp. BC1015]KAG0179527.1 hypothetical protein DFQ29_002003 [Apophysomyces sp. BC1021]KAG0189490.1 hypothetical protein DFQ28_003335 [Apophysomyces sp. BC1034]
MLPVMMPVCQQQHPHADKHPQLLASKSRHVQTHPGSFNKPLLTTMPEQTYMTTEYSGFQNETYLHPPDPLPFNGTYDAGLFTDFGFFNPLEELFARPMLTPGSENDDWKMQSIEEKDDDEEEETEITFAATTTADPIVASPTQERSIAHDCSKDNDNSDVDQYKKQDESELKQHDIALSRKESRSGIQCTNCDTQCTPLWRRNSRGEPLCNACGLFFKLHGTVRPRCLKTDVIKKRNRTSTQKRRRRSSKRTTTAAKRSSPPVNHEGHR